MRSLAYVDFVNHLLGGIGYRPNAMLLDMRGDVSQFFLGGELLAVFEPFDMKLGACMYVRQRNCGCTESSWTA